MADVWARNARGDKQRFTEIGWNLLGKNKEGWVMMEDHIIHNVANKTPIQKPITGQSQKQAKPQVIENIAPKKEIISTQKTENVLELDEDFEEESNFDEKTTAFLKAAVGIKRGDIKDFFDKQKISYKNTANTQTLTLQLAKVLNFDTIELQKSFDA